VQQQVPQQEISEKSLSVQAPSSSNNDAVATLVHQIMTELNGALSQEDRIIFIIKVVLNLIKKK
jgi:type IV secretory pathway VirB2 component (pilin)